MVRPVRVDPDGLTGPTRAQAAGSRWRRTSRGLYVPAEVDADNVEQRILEASAVLPDVAGVTGWAGLRWAGAVWFDGLAEGGRTTLDVDLASCYRDIRNQPGFRVCEEQMLAGDLLEHDGVHMTVPARSALFAMRHAPSVRAAVKVLDMAAYSDLVSLAEATEYALRLPAWTGIPQAREALKLADENSWSPKECDLRMIWRIDAGLPPPLTNRPIFDRHGRLLGTPDLLDLESGTTVEYDGGLHLVGEQRAADTTRDELFRDHGLEPLRIVGPDMAERWLVAQRMHAARARAPWEAESRRAWTLTPPPRWVETHTVAQRRALDPAQQERFLRHRRRAA